MSDTTTRRVEYMALEEVLPADVNPKRHSEADLQASMQRFGYTEPVVIDERTGKLVSGHGRINALKTLRESGATPPDGIAGDWGVPVVRGWASANDEEASAALVAANRLTIAGGWDDEQLFSLLDSLDDLTGIGYSPEQVADYIKSLEVPSLDDLEEKFGEPDERAFWPVINLRVSPETHARYQAAMENLVGEDEEAKFVALLNAADMADVA